ncbi:MAG TPA: hypothetical protein DCY39_03090 [Exiguobacterium sp.]|nr:hypothetical protein [Exiguobacterium sp.]
MKKHVVIILVVSVISIVSVGWYIRYLQTDPVIEEIEDHYMKNGIVRAYDQTTAQSLSESLGQYMQYLLLQDDADRFKKQVQVLKTNFLKKNGSDIYIKWELTKQTTTNALIDDLRISEALRQAGDQFDEPMYTRLADRVEKTLLKHQYIDGQWVDFYDWKYKQAASVLHLNYLEYNSIKRLQLLQSTKALLRQAPHVGPFTPELYFYKTGEFKWINKKTVNMIDQVLIARLQFEVTGHVDSEFSRFITRELHSGKVYTHYVRASKLPSSQVESSSVYALLLPLVSSSERSIIFKRLDSIDTTNPRSVHIFDVLNKAIEAY